MKSKHEGIAKVRIQKEQLDALLSDATRSGSSIESLVERILADYLGWDVWAKRAGFIQMHKTIIKNLFENVDEEIINRQAEELAREAKAISVIITGSSDLEAGLEVFKKMITKSGFSSVTFSNNVFLFQHNMGINCSKFYGALFTKLINDLGGKSKIDYTKNVLSVRVL